jgi:hypothetical protein
LENAIEDKIGSDLVAVHIQNDFLSGTTLEPVILLVLVFGQVALNGLTVKREPQDLYLIVLS